MSRQNRTTLKHYFRTGQKPTQEQFADLVDSGLNLAEDGIFDVGGNMGLGHDNPASRLSVNGNVSVSPNNDNAPGNGLFVHGNVGIGAGFTSPTAQLAVKGSVYIGNTETTDPGANNLKVDGNIATEGNLSINGTLHAGGNTTINGALTLADARHVATDEVRARDSGGLKLYNASGANGLRVDHDGNVLIGRNLTVTGNIRAGGLSLQGNGGQTEFLGDATGDKENEHSISVPQGRFVVGLIVRRFRSDDDKDSYTFALKYN